jgi:hypothetical protein
LAAVGYGYYYYSGYAAEAVVLEAVAWEVTVVAAVTSIKKWIAVDMEITAALG